MSEFRDVNSWHLPRRAAISVAAWLADSRRVWVPCRDVTDLRKNASVLLTARPSKHDFL